MLMENYISDSTLAKRNDPISSYVAAEKHHRSGRMDNQRQMILKGLRQYGPITCAELAEILNCDRYAPHRRMCELERDGLAVRAGFRKCRVTKQKCIVWRAVRFESTLFDYARN